MRMHIVAAPLALVLGLAAGCTPVKKMYDGPEREASQIARLHMSNSYLFSINRRRTGAAKDGAAEMLILPGTQRLIVHLDEDLAGRYGYVGVPAVFCAGAGQSYTVYPVTDPIARLWQPAVRDDATGGDVPLKPCGAADTPAAAAAPPAATPAPSPAPTPPTVTPPGPAAAPATTPAPTPPPTAPPARPAATPAPAPAATAPAAPAPGSLTAGAAARLLAPARTRSLPDAPAVAGLEAGVTVTLKVVIKKDTGPWWYVKAPAGSGWARESELEAVRP